MRWLSCSLCSSEATHQSDVCAHLWSGSSAASPRITLLESCESKWCHSRCEARAHIRDDRALANAWVAREKDVLDGGRVAHEKMRRA